MKKVFEFVNYGTISKAEYRYEVYQFGNRSFRVRCNGKPVDYVFDTVEQAQKMFENFPEI